MIASIHVTTTEAGQAILGLLVIVSYVSSHFKFHETKEKVDEVHVLVNSQMAAALERISELEKALGLQDGQPIPSQPIMSRPNTEGTE